MQNSFTALKLPQEFGFYPKWDKKLLEGLEHEFNKN